MTTTRDAFEAWIKKSLGYGNINTTVSGGYEWIAVAEAWEVWQAATEAEQCKRQPLTDDQISDMSSNYNTGRAGGDYDFARAIEAAHGITATPQGNPK